MQSARAVWPTRCAPICASARQRCAKRRPKFPLRSDLAHRDGDIADVRAARGVDEEWVAAVLESLGVAREAGAFGRQIFEARSEERCVGKECVSTCRSRWSPYHEKKTKNK